MILNGLYNKIQKLKELSLDKAIKDSVIEHSDEAVELMKLQLQAGIDITGNKRIDAYAPAYAELKPKKYVGIGAITDTVTFYATGELYSDLKMFINGNSFEIKSDLEKFDWMVERITDPFYGLSPQSRAKFAAQFILPELKTVINETLRD